MFKLPGLTIFALLFAISLASAQPACLPKSVFAKNGNEDFPVIDLGYINSAQYPMSGAVWDRRLNEASAVR
jgi:hypothetical protein